MSNLFTDNVPGVGTVAAIQAAATAVDPQLISLKAAGPYYGIGTRHLRRRVQDGTLEHVRVGGRIFFRRSVLDDYIAKLTVPAAAVGGATVAVVTDTDTTAVSA